ncbi:hypothetical protein S101267_02774 [Bacillus amyloliquefaciens]|nr:hypothetical protein S101267_02774 [Bacillus amyloliquefaciens]
MKKEISLDEYLERLKQLLENESVRTRAAL